jgi:hypothetical protein
MCDSSNMYGKLIALQRSTTRRNGAGAIQASDCRLALSGLMRYGSSPLLCFWAVSGRSHSETVGGLHRLPHHSYQIVTQSVEIGLVSELGGEGF